MYLGNDFAKVFVMRLTYSLVSLDTIFLNEWHSIAPQNRVHFAHLGTPNVVRSVRTGFGFVDNWYGRCTIMVSVFVLVILSMS